MQKEKYRVFWKYHNKTPGRIDREHSNGFDSEQQVIEYIRDIVASTAKIITNIRKNGQVLYAREMLAILYKADSINRPHGT